METDTEDVCISFSKRDFWVLKSTVCWIQELGGLNHLVIASSNHLSKLRSIHQFSPKKMHLTLGPVKEKHQTDGGFRNVPFFLLDFLEFRKFGKVTCVFFLLNPTLEGGHKDIFWCFELKVNDSNDEMT